MCQTRGNGWRVGPMNWSTNVAAVVAVVAVALALAGSIAWFAGEQHYKNCVNAAIARTPVLAVAESNPFKDNPWSAPTRVDGRAERKRAIGGCSRMP